MDSKKTSEKSVHKSRDYLDVVYSDRRVSYGDYPYLLAKWLLDNVYKKTGHLIDLGCGRGDQLNAFAKLGFDVMGVDISPRAPELAKDYCVKVADFEKDPLPFKKNSFDFVFSKSVIEHMRNPLHLFSKAMEALKPGGIAVIMTPSWAHTYWGPFYIHHSHISPFTIPALRDALLEGGFESVNVSYFYQLPFLWKYPALKPIVQIIATLPLPYRPYQSIEWIPDNLNKIIRFSKEVMLLGVGRKPSD